MALPLAAFQNPTGGRNGNGTVQTSTPSSQGGLMGALQASVRSKLTGVLVAEVSNVSKSDEFAEERAWLLQSITEAEKRSSQLVQELEAERAQAKERSRCSDAIQVSLRQEFEGETRALVQHAVDAEARNEALHNEVEAERKTALQDLYDAKSNADTMTREFEREYSEARRQVVQAERQLLVERDRADAAEALTLQIRQDFEKLHIQFAASKLALDGDSMSLEEFARLRQDYLDAEERAATACMALETARQTITIRDQERITLESRHKAFTADLAAVHSQMAKTEAAARAEVPALEENLRQCEEQLATARLGVTAYQEQALRLEADNAELNQELSAAHAMVAAQALKLSEADEAQRLIVESRHSAVSAAATTAVDAVEGNDAHRNRGRGGSGGGSPVRLTSPRSSGSSLAGATPPTITPAHRCGRAGPGFPLSYVVTAPGHPTEACPGDGALRDAGKVTVAELAYGDVAGEAGDGHGAYGALRAALLASRPNSSDASANGVAGRQLMPATTTGSLFDDEPAGADAADDVAPGRASGQCATARGPAHEAAIGQPQLFAGSTSSLSRARSLGHGTQQWRPQRRRWWRRRSWRTTRRAPIGPRRQQSAAERKLRRERWRRANGIPVGPNHITVGGTHAHAASDAPRDGRGRELSARSSFKNKYLYLSLSLCKPTVTIP
eukprot:NODE_2269_length_2252_cov_6.988235.p1 GENE.NODE_2269_length_2252_cov_6.988235~~NODE_2269_length_2252_cov_6.988235.p1  ORF type:complete len:749 (-),score=159.71 NODE_2269_length_2252_cov_6.988235:4-2028(-)